MNTEDNSSSSSSSEDEYPPEISEVFEKSFFKTLSSLKNKDPSIYDKETKFFDDNSEITATTRSKTDRIQSQDKPLFFNEYERKRLTENEGRDDDENVTSQLSTKPNSIPYSVEQRQLKESFKSFLEDSDDDENGTLLKVCTKSENDKEKEESDYIKWLKGQKEELEDKSTETNLKKLRDYWNSEGLDQDEAFLRDYILNKRFIDQKNSDDDEDDGNLTEESETLEAQEDYEHKYNFRYENEDVLLRRFPRNIENSLRRKDNKRSKKRVEVKERKEIEKKKKRDEINRQKKIKCKEISERLEKLKELTGNEKLAFNDADIINDFDPDEYDKKMAQMYDDEFYHIEDEEKPRIDDIDLSDIKEDINNENNDGNHHDDSFNTNEIPLRKNKKKTRTEKKKERKKKTFSDLSAIEKPVYDPKLHESYEKFMDEYYKLDCEDFIEDIPCRFKYKQVQPNDFGLTIEEILAADDKELNRWSSIKKIHKIRSNHVEKNEAKIYKLKGQNEMLKKKILPSLFKQEGENEDDDEIVHHQDDNKKKNKSKKKKKKLNINNEQSASDAVETCDTANTGEENPNETEEKSIISNSNNVKKKKNKNKKRNRGSAESTEVINSNQSITENDFNETVSDSVQTVETDIVQSPVAGHSSCNDDDHRSVSPHKSHSKNHLNSKTKRYSKGNKSKKNHDFHETRLAAYGLNPKKFRVK